MRNARRKKKVCRLLCKVGPQTALTNSFSMQAQQYCVLDLVVSGRITI